MKNNEEKLKDAILLELCEKNGEATLNKISEELKLDYYLVDYLSDDLIARGFVYFKQISGGNESRRLKNPGSNLKRSLFFKIRGIQ